MTPSDPKTFPCPECKGTTRVIYSHRPSRPCTLCTAGTVTVDRNAIKDTLISTRGANKGRLRRSRPALPQDGGVYGAAYCWRMIRFDVGADMTMPMAAPFYVGNPGKEITAALDEASDALGAELFGKAAVLRGAARWHGAMTGDYRLADVLGVGVGTVGFDIGGITESPEYWSEQPAAAVAAVLDAPAIED